MRPKLHMSQTLQTTKKNFEKLSGSQIFKTTIGIRFNLPEVFPFVSFFCIRCVIYTFFSCFAEKLFLCFFPSLVAVLSV